VAKDSFRTWSLRALSAIAVASSATAAAAQGAAQEQAVGFSQPGQMGMQTPGSPIAQDIVWFHDWLLFMCVAICLFVLGLLIYVMARFNEKAHPVPSRVTHNTTLEIAWTLIPVLILVMIAIPSFRMLRQQLVIPKADLVVKVTGATWNWRYGYPDQGGFEFVSALVADEDLKPGQPRLLTVDDEMIVPVGKVVHLQVTAADVIHSFAIPSLGVRIDAVPGRLNDSWFLAEREGLYRGQCSKLCGKDHAFMPIAVRVVSQEAFDRWTASKQPQKKAASFSPILADAAASARQ
jgi:cytochrome c oxidase subunit 2